MSLPPKRKSQIDGEKIPSLIPGGKPLFVPALPKGFNSDKVQYTPIENFPREAQAQDSENETGTNQKTNNTMAKKKSSSGKIAFVDAQLLSGKYTKSEIAAALATDFKVPVKTARNTVSWCASTIGDRHDGKESKHKPEVKDDTKPTKATKSKAKAAPKKKSAAPKSKAPKKKAEKVEAKAETAGEPVTA